MLLEESDARLEFILNLMNAKYKEDWKNYKKQKTNDTDSDSFLFMLPHQTNT